ncbi:hypothetical protein MMC22_008379 [Lobaria immixta]|nr:hypothetical protein [Lobaria immixta]
MSRSPQKNDNNPPEDVRQSTVSISEWVDQQSLSMPPPKVIISTPTPDSKSETRQSTSGSLAGETRQRKAYGIPTLLRLGEAIAMKHMELRIHPGALTEHIFKDKNQKAYPKSQEKIRHRGLSDHSTLSHRTRRSEEEAIFSGREWINTQKPYREPQNPPKEPFAQQHEGFKRFLKQVASPPHNRVTAGGRIVPAGPSFPPPMLNYGSIETTINQPVSKTLPSINVSTKSNALGGSTNAQTSLHMLPGQYKANQNTNPSGLHQLEAAEFQNSGNMNRGGFNGNISMGGTIQFPPGIEPLYWLAGGGAIVSFNGVQYQASWNGPQLVLETLPPATPFFTPTPEHAAVMYAQVTHNPHYPTVIKAATATEAQVSLTNTTSLYGSRHLQPDSQSNRKSLNEEIENLRARLLQLDQHLAVHFNRLSEFEHSALVAQRYQFVEKIDSIRKRIERTNSSSAPVVGQHTAIGIQSHQHPGSAEYCPPVVTSSLETKHLKGNPSNSNHDAAQAPLVNKKSLASSTCLSPDAPPFVPSNTKTRSDGSSLGKPWGAPAQSNHSFVESGSQDKGRVPNYGPGIEVSSATHAISLTGQKEGQGANGTASRWEEPPRESLPLVSQEDVEYAARLGLNPACGEKLYCTTVPEFQEVIRRVREQARLYGCRGGQSKDPAFDAEQDIRWAMADRDAIRLPKSTPDHVAKPRPWSWNDSDFNVRVNNNSASASTNGHSSSTYVASNSQDQSGADILDDPFSIVTDRRADSWDSDPGVDDFTIDRKHTQHGLTPAKGISDVKCETIDPKPNTVPETPKPDRTRGFTMRSVSNGSAIHTPPESTKEKTPQSSRRPYQSYVEDSFGTPTSGRAQVTCKGLPASGQEDKGASKRNATINDVSFEHLNPRERPVNQTSDWGTGKLISVDGQPTKHAYELVRLGYLDHVATDPTKRDGNNKYDSWAPITDSKSCWGPENDTESLDAWRIPKSYDWVGAGPANLCSNNFLRGILKSPHYAYPPTSHSVPSAAEMRLRAKHRAELEKHAAKKENLKAEAQCEMEKATAHGPSPSTPSVVSQEARRHKASSSLASSNFQVRGVIGSTGNNEEHMNSSSSQYGGYAPQYSGMEHHSQLPVTPLHYGPPDFYFATEVRQDNGDPSYPSRSGIPQYDGAWDDMAKSIDLNDKDSSENNTTGGTSKQALDSKRLIGNGYHINNQYHPRGHEAFIIRFFQSIRKEEEQARKQKYHSKSS